MKSDFRLVGLSKPKSASLQFLHSDKTTFWASIEMPEDRINALWDYCKDNWHEKKIAEIEHNGLYEDGTPIKPIMIGVREWDIQN